VSELVVDFKIRASGRMCRLVVTPTMALEAR